MPKAKSKPAYTLHKRTGQARVRIAGKDHYLGQYGSDESRERYDELMAEWFSREDVQNCTLTVDDVALLYTEYATGYYLDAEGNPTSETGCIKLALRPLIKLHGRTKVRSFGPLALKQVRQTMVDDGFSRKTINSYVHRIRRMFGWAVENELCPPGVHAALRCVASLKLGRSKAREPEKVKPVAQAVVDATLPFLTAPLAAMVRVQLLAGMRPGEVCRMRPCDIDRTGAAWCYIPSTHKTAYRGRERRIFLGPQAQQVLLPFLLRDSQAYCFSPLESQAERNAAKRAARKSPMTPSQLARRPLENPQWSPGRRYTRDSFCRAVARAARAAKVEAWSPNMLRHTAATKLRAEHGIEAARLVLGHADPGVTLVYAEKDFQAAANIMSKTG